MSVVSVLQEATTGSEGGSAEKSRQETQQLGEIHKLHENQEVSGYTRRCKLTNAWLYSERCIELVKAYAREFPELFDKLTYLLNNDVFFESDLWPQDVGKNKPQDVVQWIKSQPHASALRRECGSDALEPEEMLALSKTLEKQLEELKSKERNVTLHVKWNLLYKPELQDGNVQPDAAADFKIYDRVVCVARHTAAPLGARGTVTAVLAPAAANTVRLSDRLNAQPACHVMFDEPFPGAMHEDLFEDARFYRMLPSNMLNISYGRKLRDAVSCDETQPFNYTPSVLRRDQHHSAFASYSPPREIKPQAPENRNTTPPNNNNKNGQPQDNATNLLKSLLKISEDEAESNKIKNKVQTPPEASSSWRVKNEQPMPSPPSNRSAQQNWRKDNVFNRPHPPQGNEWTNSSYKQPPMPPLPTFGRPLPFPEEPAAPFFTYQQRETDGYHDNRNHGTRNHRNQNQNHFPQHLPNVGQPMLGPTWNTTNMPPMMNPHQPPNNNPSGSASAEKLSNPFVPLQVQTSQRRVQNTGGSSSRRDLEGLPAPKTMQPQPRPINQPVTQHQGMSKPQKKKKPRIAANLPFQMD